MTIKRRLSSPITSYKLRCHSLTSSELRKKKKLRKIIILLTILIKREKDFPISDRLDKLNMGLAYILVRYHSLKFCRVPEMRRPRRRTNYISRSIESFSDEDCWKLFRTRKTDLYRLRRALKLDQDVFIADNGTKFTGDEILLIGLHTYCISGPIDQTTSFRFSLELSQLSRAFSIFNRHVLNNFKQLLTDNLSYWVDLFPYFAECISKRLADSCDIHYPAGSFRVFGFHDDTVIATCPPPNGERHDNYIQMAFYNGWKRHHGYKYQTLELPNGMCADMYGPTSFIHHDLELLRDSKLNEKLADIQLGRIHQYVSYGDGIFPIDSHTIGKHIGNTTKEERYENRMMSKIRIANEWDYGSTADLFPFIKWRAAQKTRRNDSVTRYYFIATILRNAHMCLYEGLTSRYFNCTCPTLENYFKVEEIQ